MTTRFTALSRTVALSVAITLVVAPIASAQTPEAATPSAPPANTVLLNDAAFARLLQPAPAEAAPAPVVADSPRSSLLGQGKAAMAREAQTATTQAPQQKSWVSRHPKALYTIVIVAGLFTGLGIYLWEISA